MKTPVKNNKSKSKKKEKPPVSPEKLLKQDRARAAKAAKNALEAEQKRKEAAMTPEERRAKMVAEAKRLGEERRRKVAEEEARVEAAKEARAEAAVAVGQGVCSCTPCSVALGEGGP